MVNQLLPVLSVFFIFLPLNLDAQDWNRKVFSEANFSIQLKGEFKQSVREVNDPVFGDIRLNQFSYTDTTDGGIMLYTVFYTDYPADMVHSDSTDLLDEFFIATAESAAYSVAGNLVYSDDLQNRECPGYTWRIHYNVGEAVVRSRAYLCCSRLYILSVANLAEGVSTDNIFRFFDSFSLIRSCMD